MTDTQIATDIRKKLYPRLTGGNFKAAEAELGKKVRIGLSKETDTFIKTLYEELGRDRPKKLTAEELKTAFDELVKKSLEKAGKPPSAREIVASKVLGGARDARNPKKVIVCQLAEIRGGEQYVYYDVKNPEQPDEGLVNPRIVPADEVPEEYKEWIRTHPKKPAN